MSAPTVAHTQRIISWNVNGLQGILKKDLSGNKSKEIVATNPLSALIKQYTPTILCLQEIRCSDRFSWTPPNYPYTYASHCTTNSSRSGTLVASQTKPLQVEYGIAGIEEPEGRVITLEYDDFILVNVYTPNSGSTRLDYRYRKWEPAFLQHIRTLQTRGKAVIVVGDLNVAPTDLDAESKVVISGTTPEERVSFAHLLKSTDLVDAWREKHPSTRAFTWLHLKERASTNLYKGGWRFDFTLIPRNWLPLVTAAEILPFPGSDHVPVCLQFTYTK